MAERHGGKLCQMCYWGRAKENYRCGLDPEQGTMGLHRAVAHWLTGQGSGSCPGFRRRLI